MVGMGLHDAEFQYLEGTIGTYISNKSLLLWDIQLYSYNTLLKDIKIWQDFRENFPLLCVSVDCRVRVIQFYRLYFTNYLKIF